MLWSSLFFLATFATLAALIWAGIELLRVRENPLADRLAELQSSAMVSTGGRVSRRNGRGGFLNWVLYLVSAVGGEDWLRDTEKELSQAGLRKRQALAAYVLFNVAFMGLL